MQWIIVIVITAKTAVVKTASVKIVIAGAKKIVAAATVKNVHAENASAAKNVILIVPVNRKNQYSRFLKSPKNVLAQRGRCKMHADKDKTIRLLKTVKGQIEGLIKMCEENRYCIDISTQILASQSILKKVNLEILKGHFEHCITETLKNGTESDRDKKMEEIIAVLNKILN